ncbi:MAG: MATE family efflux transporter [Alphaproteobacteria bacterium]|nr:MATE family efflux transporter [Alphaproteobacteria bacterium]MCW5739053.1 MATE family efflux transporter [Alphaproteobacteria bacterium]
MSHPLLAAPIAPSLLRLAGPTTGIMAVQILVGIAETWFVSRLGTEALAGFALVFPFMAMTHNLANGGMGGGIAAAMARALGGGRLDDARALALHALILALVCALIFAIFAWTIAPAVYQLMGGSGPALDHALAFSQVWFSGAVVVWIGAFLSAMLRGGGDAVTPARYGLLGSLIYIPFSGALSLGVGDWSGLGIAGLAIASLLTAVLTTVPMARALWRGRLGFTPDLSGPPQARRFREILRVGLPGSATTLTDSLAVILVTGLVGRFGPAALAGYGIGARLQYMVGPLAYGIGTGLTTMVGVAAGAKAWSRAVRVAWFGGLVAFGVAGAIGWSAALLPQAWSRLFTADVPVIAASVAYITWVAPFYGLFGLGLALNFASQGAGRMTVPFIAGIMRVLIVTVGSWLAVEKLSFGLEGIFVAIALATAAYGGAIAGALLVRPWRSAAV